MNNPIKSIRQRNWQERVCRQNGDSPIFLLISVSHNRWFRQTVPVGCDGDPTRSRHDAIASHRSVTSRLVDPDRVRCHANIYPDHFLHTASAPFFILRSYFFSILRQYFYCIFKCKLCLWSIYEFFVISNLFHTIYVL